MADNLLSAVLQNHPELFSEHVDLESRIDHLRVVFLAGNVMAH